MDRAEGTDGAEAPRHGATAVPRRRPVDPTRIRLVSLAVYLSIVVVMVLVAGPASATPATPDPTTASTDLLAIAFTVVVGGGLVARTILRRGRLYLQKVPVSPRPDRDRTI